MITDTTWNEFCELYYEGARNLANMHLAKLRKRLGAFDRHVDEDYVVDSATLSALEKTFASYDSVRGVKIMTYLSTLVHNEMVDVLKKETREASVKTDVENLKSAVMSVSGEMDDDVRTRLLARLTNAISKLSPSDQIILNNYLEDRAAYVTASARVLGISENYVRVRRMRIFDALPKLMEMTREQYLRLSLDKDGLSLAGSNGNVSMETSARKCSMHYSNLLVPSVDLCHIAAKLLKVCEQESIFSEK